MNIAQRVAATLRGRFSEHRRAPSGTVTRKISKNDIANVLCVVGLAILVTSLTVTSI